MARPGFAKYRNKKVVAFGFKFDSKREADRWGTLVVMQSVGMIRNLRRQVSIKMKLKYPGKRRVMLGRGRLKQYKVIEYRADFVYVDVGGKTVVEDAKGWRTSEYLAKRRLLKAMYGITVHEV